MNYRKLKPEEEAVNLSLSVREAFMLLCVLEEAQELDSSMFAWSSVNRKPEAAVFEQNEEDQK